MTMQTCDSTCYWCATHFWLWLKARMYSSQRHAGRSGEGDYAEAASTSIKAPADDR